ncbi:MAG: thiamine phosphate synthase, partial [Pedobacter sp.]
MQKNLSMAITIDKLQYISQKPSNGSQLDAIQAVLEAGCKWIQLRAKNLDEDELLAIARQSRNLCEQYGAKLIVNDNPIVALRASAHGVHLGRVHAVEPHARAPVHPRARGARRGGP